MDAGRGGCIVGEALFIPALRTIFLFDVLSPVDLLVCFVAGTVSIMRFEGIRAVRKRWLERLG